MVLPTASSRMAQKACSGLVARRASEGDGERSGDGERKGEVEAAGGRDETRRTSEGGTGGGSDRGRGPERGMAWWVANVLQPIELMKLLGKGFLFYAAFSVTTFAVSAKSALKAQPMATRFDTFVEAANRNDVRALHVDGNQLTWVPRARKMVAPPVGSDGIPFDAPREVEVVYHTSRPKDAPMPYEVMLKNGVDMSAPDPRNAPNFAPWIALLMFVLLVNVFRNQGQGNFGGPAGRGAPGGISMPGVQRGGRAPLFRTPPRPILRPPLQDATRCPGCSRPSCRPRGSQD